MGQRSWAAGRFGGEGQGMGLGPVRLWASKGDQGPDLAGSPPSVQGLRVLSHAPAVAVLRCQVVSEGPAVTEAWLAALLVLLQEAVVSGRRHIGASG